MSIENMRILSKVAHMYYEEGYTQAEIAANIGVSRSLISKFLTKARELGIVEIIIHDAVHKYRQLERELEKLYNIREVVCIESIGLESTKKQLGEATAEYLFRILKDGQIVGFSSGTTLYEVAQAINGYHTYESSTVVPLVGGIGNERVDVHSNTIVAKVGSALQANYKLLHLPVMVDTKEAKEVLKRQQSIRNILEMGEQVDVAVVGIGGSPEHSTIVKSYLGFEHERVAGCSDIVGDICYNFIDQNGNPVENDWNERVISIEIEKLRKLPLVIGVAAGIEKVEAIKAALRGNLIQVLITDEVSGKALLDSGK